MLGWPTGDLRPDLHKVWLGLTYLIKRLGSDFFKSLLN